MGGARPRARPRAVEGTVGVGEPRNVAVCTTAGAGAHVCDMACGSTLPAIALAAKLSTKPSSDDVGDLAILPLSIWPICNNANSERQW